MDWKKISAKWIPRVMFFNLAAWSFFVFFLTSALWVIVSRLLSYSHMNMFVFLAVVLFIEFMLFMSAVDYGVDRGKMIERKRQEFEKALDEVSLCHECMSMTHTFNGKCGKCEKVKP